jgi:hypothetical protein
MGITVKMNEKKKTPFLLKLLLFIVLLILLDFSIGSFLKYLYYRQESGLLYRTTYSIDSTTADVLIFGASRANHHYFPGIFEQRMNLSYYNVGRDGNAIFYHYAILKGVLKRYRPKIAILDFCHKDFMQNTDSYDRISALLPYYEDHPEIRSVIPLKGPYETYKLASRIYPYNSMVFTIAIGNTAANRNRNNNNDVKGYVPLTRVWSNPIVTDTTQKNYPLDSNKINIYKAFIKECNDNNVKLYIMFSPYFINYKYEDPSVVVAKKIAMQYNTTCYDFSNLPPFSNNAALFTDESHLNDQGARVYSNLVIDRMTKEQQQIITPAIDDHSLTSQYSMTR